MSDEHIDPNLLEWQHRRANELLRLKDISLWSAAVILVRGVWGKLRPASIEALIGGGGVKRSEIRRGILGLIERNIVKATLPDRDDEAFDYELVGLRADIFVVENVDAAWGGMDLFLTKQEWDRYLYSPKAFAAQHIGLTVGQYEEWLKTDGIAFCGATSKNTGRPCRNVVCSDQHPNRWKAVHRVLRCRAHSDQGQRGMHTATLTRARQQARPRPA